jgi:predicted PurR-regulated permease PerM
MGTLVVLAVVVGFLLVYRFRIELIILFSGIVVSMAITPSVDWLQRHKLPRAVSVILIYLVLLVLLVLFFVLLVPPIIAQLSAAVPKIELYYQELKTSMAQSPLLVIRQITLQMPAVISLSLSSAPAAGGSFDAVSQAVTTASGLLGGIYTLAAILLIGFYWTLEGEAALHAIIQPLSTERRESAHEILDEIGTRVGGYVRGQGLLAVAIGVADLIVFLIIGLPAALAVALLAGLFELIPVLGPTLGAIPAVLVAFAYDPSKVIWVIVVGALLQFVENNLLAPRVMHKAVGVNPMVTLLAIIAFSALFGFAGLLLAIPMAAIIQILLDRSILRPQSSGLDVPTGRDRLSRLRFDAQEYVVDIRNLAQRKATGSAESELDPVEDSLERIAMDLDQVLAQAAPPENKV